MFLTPTEAVLVLRKPDTPGAQEASLRPHRPGNIDQAKPGAQDGASAVVRIKLIDANSSPEIAGVEELPGKVNYFVGNDQRKWRTNVRTYRKVWYKDVYPGIDLVYYGNQGQLEYDFVVAPGADPSVISLAFENTENMRLGEQGDLVVSVAGGEVRQHKPLVYQEVDGVRQEIAGDYVLKDNLQVGFTVAAYDARRPLIIDPVLVYASYLGGSALDVGNDIAVDSSGNAYVTGRAVSADFPTANPFQATFAGSNGDAFVTKVNAAGSALVYSTFLGGSSFEEGIGIAVDSSGNAYLTGITQSTTNFPTVNPLQGIHGGGGNFQDVFITKVNAAGSALVYSTFLGGQCDDSGRGIALDSSNNAYVTGTTGNCNVNNFPTLNPIQGTFGGRGDVFITKVNAAGSALVYSTFLGGSGFDGGGGIAVDNSGNAYVAGHAGSADFPTTNPFQAIFGGSSDAFVAKVNAAGSALVYSTFLGGSSGEFGRDIAVDGSGNAYVTGTTASTDFPTANPFQATFGGSFNDAFVAKVDPSQVGLASLVYSTYLGGNNQEFGRGIAVDGSGNAYVTGRTFSANFPTLNPFQGLGAAYVTKLDTSGSALVFSSHLGGGSQLGHAIAVDSSGNAYVTGSTSGMVTVNPFQATFGGSLDAFVAKIGPATCTDNDGDGFGSPGNASCPNGAAEDCNDSVSTIFPGGSEICDGFDNDCSGVIDDNIAPVLTTCGVGVCTGNAGLLSCLAGSLVDSCDPSAGATAEVCDALDNDCNAVVDDGIAAVATTCGVGVCTGNAGLLSCLAGSLVDSCDPLGGASAEVCDALDNDCNDVVDDGIADIATGSGVGECQSQIQSCSGGAFTIVQTAIVPATELCDGLDNDCNDVVDDGIADIATGSDVGECQSQIQSCSGGAFAIIQTAIGPATELCDGLDNDCNDVVDNGIADILSGSDVGECQSQIQSCSGGAFTIVQTAIGPATELCDGLDNDCNDVVDNGIADILSGSDVGECQSQIQSCSGGAFTIVQTAIGPATELCDGLDNDCNDVVDNGIADILSGSDVGECQSQIQSCSGGAFTIVQTAIGPATELCDGLDNDCNDVVDNGIADILSGSDVGECQSQIQSCSDGAFAIIQTAIGPATELCDGLDNDCNDVVDNGIADIVTGSNVGECQSEIQSCSGGAFTIVQTAIGPAAELCDGLDNDCNDVVDNGIADIATGSGVGECQSQIQSCSGGAFTIIQTAIVPATELCDGLDNDCNAVVDDGELNISANTHTVGAGTHPGSTKDPLAGIVVCAYDKSEGSCSRDTCGGISHQHYQCIVDSCGTDDGEQIFCCTTDDNGECAINAPPGDYIAISDDATKTTLPDPLGVSASDLVCQEVMQKHLQQIVKADGKKVPGKTSRRTGSEVLVIEPEFIEWTGSQELYPFVFETVGDWEVTTAVTPPEGFVSDYDVLAELVVNEVEAVQFTITDIGSDWVPTEAKHTVSHNGRRQVILSRVGVKLASDLAQQKGLARSGHVLNQRGKPVSEAGFDPRAPRSCEIVGWIEPSALDANWTVMVRVDVSTDLTLQITRGEGLVVETLASGNYTSGDYEFTWDAGNLGSGRYFVTLVAGQMVQKVPLIEE